MERVPSYKYLCVWLDDKLSFKKHVTELVKKLKFKVGIFYGTKACLTFVNRKEIVQATFMSTIDYGDIIYMHATSSTLKPLDTVFHCVFRLITGDGYRTHHCVLDQKSGLGLFVCKERAACYCVYLQSTHAETFYVSIIINSI